MQGGCCGLLIACVTSPYLWNRMDGEEVSVLGDIMVSRWQQVSFPIDENSQVRKLLSFFENVSLAVRNFFRDETRGK